MRRAGLFWVLITGAAGSLALGASPAMAQPARAGWNGDHPLALGVRAVGRAGNYGLAGAGGHVRLRPHERVAIELFADHFFGAMSGAFRHDHEVGGTLQVSVLGDGRTWSVHPTLGACAVLAVVHSPQSDGATAHDIHFGVRAGLGAEYALGGGFALEGHAEAIGYVGHDFQVYRWSAEVSPDLSFYGVGQLTAGLNYYF